MKGRTIASTFACCAVAAGALSSAREAYGMAAIVNSTTGNGLVALGINDAGHLNIPDPPADLNPRGLSLGLSFIPVGDATSPGCLCEGWGVSATTGGGPVSGYANVSVDTVVNLAVDGFVSAVSSATSDVHLISNPGIRVRQAYSEADVVPSVFFKNEVTISNTTGEDISDVRYVRVMDWDVPPTEFDEFVTILGTGTTSLLERSHNNGFHTANPLVDGPLGNPITVDSDFVDYFSPGIPGSSSEGDHGAYFRFNFGDLANGDTHEFTVYYGAARSEKEALAAIAAEGIELFSLGQADVDGFNDDIPGGPSDGLTFIFGFKGVGGEPFNPVPEPVTATLGALGLTALAGATRRRRA